MSRLPVILIACLAGLLSMAGCGEEGAEEGAVLTVYVSAPLRGSEADQGRRRCAEAREAARVERGDGDHELRVVCLDASGPGGRWTLAKVGSNARRATEDSTAIAYIGEPDPRARRQSRPIVEAAEMVEFGETRGRRAIEEILAALREGDASDPRQAVFDAVEG
jgi:hypothetical protein